MKDINLRKKNFKVGLVLGLLFFMTLPFQVQAQLQTFDFSGNSPDSYQCFDNTGKTYLNGEDPGPVSAIIPSPIPGVPGSTRVNIYKDNFSGYYLCEGFDYDGVAGADRAVLRPPALQQVEIWFVRILYIIWALVGSFSFFLLVGVGYEYLLRGGTSDTELVKLRKRISNFAIGFALVFLAVPILTTVFNLLGINKEADCYNVNMPGFQFFFAQVCTGNETLLRNACSSPLIPIPDGLACGTPGQALFCPDLSETVPPPPQPMYFYCSTGSGSNSRGTWIQIF